MTTINTGKAIQRYRTEEEMCKALYNFCAREHTMCIPAQVDDDDIVLMDVIAELLERRSQEESK
jgi:hypothetical protein